MSAPPAERLFDLLPALYREQDAVEGANALGALVGLLGEQAEALREDVDRLWNDLFVETCRPWVIPYIGDLVGNELLHDTSIVAGPQTAATLFPDLVGPLTPPPAVRTRADVAKTIGYRRRKGTIAMLEELARDVTGWPAHAVEFFQLLGWTQHLEHRRLGVGWTDVRSVERMDRVGGAFDDTSHTVDVRPLGETEGWYGIPKVGFFLWRLQSFPLQNVPARVASAPWRFHVSPLGNRAPLFTRWRREASPTGRARELDVAGPIRRTFFFEDLRRFHATTPRPPFTDLYGLFAPVDGLDVVTCRECSLFVLVDGRAVPPAAIVCRRLRPWPELQPAAGEVSVDVVEGRIALGSSWAPSGEPPRVDVFFHYGFAAALGGGPYERRAWLVRTPPGTLRLDVEQRAAAGSGRFTSVVDALTFWQGHNRPRAIVRILDSRTYALPAGVALPNDGSVVLEAANGQRPVLRTPVAGLRVDVDAPLDPADPRRAAELTLSGVVVEGFVHVVGDLARLRLLHATLVPGRHLLGNGQPFGNGSSVRIRGTRAGDRINAELRVELAFSIAGRIIVPPHARAVSILDSIVDGVGLEAVSGRGKLPGPPLEVERSTIFGGVHVRSLEASETIFTALVETVRTQEGCVRFSYVPPGSRTPRRYRCQPDLAIATAQARDATVDADAVRERVVPGFVARHYGQPAYAQLRLTCPREIAQGAEDEAEMGVFNHLKQHQRIANLELRMREYLPFGLEAGVIFVT